MSRRNSYLVGLTRPQLRADPRFLAALGGYGRRLPDRSCGRRDFRSRVSHAGRAHESPSKRMAEPAVDSPRANLTVICAIFFCSGIPALIYQLVWQRSLFTIYGINVESVTVVVTAFMLGLGIGSFAGGRLSRLRLPLLGVFAAVELGIGLFGYFSLGLFHAVGELTLQLSAPLTALFTFLLVLVPTLLM